MCTVPGCGRSHCRECVKNQDIDGELKEAMKAVSKLKSLQCIKQQSGKPSNDGKQSSSSFAPCSNANSAEIAQLEKAKAAAAHFEEINTDCDSDDFYPMSRFTFSMLNWDSLCPNSEYHVYSMHTCLDIQPILEPQLGSALDCATTGD
eukprot:2029620-Rhodomonas_salina.1